MGPDMCVPKCQTYAVASAPIYSSDRLGFYAEIQIFVGQFRDRFTVCIVYTLQYTVFSKATYYKIHEIL